jgi:hypothetical protein
MHDVGSIGPHRNEIGPTCDDQQSRQRRYTVNKRAEQLIGCRINPMYILKYCQHRLIVRQSFELAKKRFQRLFLTRLRIIIRQKVILAWHRQKICNKSFRLIIH